MTYEEKLDFERALKIATAQINSDGELIYHTLETAKQDEEAGCFAISLDELYRFYLVIKGNENVL